MLSAGPSARVNRGAVKSGRRRAVVMARRWSMGRFRVQGSGVGVQEDDNIGLVWIGN
jgi:hypothetical protein